MSIEHVKRVKHKPTLPPMQCDHCHKIWYGQFCDGKGSRMVPLGRTLCMSCWSALDNYLYEHHNEEYQAVVSRSFEEDDCEWKKSFPQFFERADMWISNPKQSPKPRKSPYSHIPQWVRIAIESGAMLTNSECVYTVTTCGYKLIQVDKSLDRSKLKPFKF